jgi:CheY-like chemotaxis protein
VLIRDCLDLLRSVWAETNFVMLDHDDLKWIAATSTDLNSMVQQISRYADLAKRHKGEHHYLDLLNERVELASKTAQALFDRVTSKILEGTARKNQASKGVFTVVPPPSVTLPSQPARATVSVGSRSMPEKAEATMPHNGSNALGLAPDVRIKNPKGNREYVLVVEDEPEVADLAAEMLADEGYKVIIAHDGFEALKIYQTAARQIALVILDFFLPVMDGDAVFDELRTINPNANVVLSSGFAEQTKIASMLERGLRGFIPKPYGQQKLLEQVRSVLDAGRQPTR